MSGTVLTGTERGGTLPATAVTSRAALAIVLTVVMTAERAKRGRPIGVLAGLGLIAAGVLVAVQPDRIG